jgi:hypothetical protein
VATALLVLVACSYRLDLARYHTVVGIDGLMGWWTYVLRNVDSLDAGQGFATGTLYAPGQSVASWLVLHGLDGRDDPAVLRVVFGLVDGCAVVFVVLAGKELLSWAAGLVAGLLYALWPAGASASVNLLHDHSPQPLFALVGIWLVLIALRRERLVLLFVGACLLGLPALFRADGSVVAPALALGVATYVWRARGGLCRGAALGAVALAGVLAPSLPYDAWILGKTGRLQHIAMGDAGAAVFMRVGRASGIAGARNADWEISFLGGSDDPFGFEWIDARRASVLATFGRTLFWAHPAGYVRLVWSELRSTFTERAGRAAWWAADVPRGETRRATAPSGRMESVAASIGNARVLQGPSDPPWIYVLGALGTLVGLFARRPGVLVPGCVAGCWMAALAALVPNSRYLLMPSCLLFPLAGVFIALAARVVGRAVVRTVGPGRWAVGPETRVP